MLQNIVLKNNLKNNYCYLNSITKQGIFALNNKRNYTLLNNNSLCINLPRSNLLNLHSNSNFNNCYGNILSRKYTSDNIENKSTTENENENNKIEEEKKTDNNINETQNKEENQNDNNNKNDKKNHSGNKKEKKSKSDFPKIMISLLGGVGIGYGINYLITNNLNKEENILSSIQKRISPENKNEKDSFEKTFTQKAEINVGNNNNNKDLKNDVTVDIKIKEKKPNDNKVSVTKINFDSKKGEVITTSNEKKESVVVNVNGKKEEEESNPIIKNINDTINYIGSFFGFGGKEVEEEAISEFDKEIEDAYLEIINNINKAPSEIKIKNLRNNESININADSINSEESLKEIEERLKSWGDEIAKNKPSKSFEKPEEKSVPIVINNNVNPKKGNDKIVDFVNDMVTITDDTKNNKKIIKVSAKPIAKAFHEASKISNSFEKNKNNMSEFIADCIKETTDTISKLSDNNVDIQNTFLDTVKIFSDSMNAISDYLDQLEIEIKTELDNNDNNDNNK
ncbi:hypothetical protein BCR32DRAFT_328768 [Anaeromyces robustus]|uniref:Uncharacterized protein n=1 Tax=Anaeromyces robustus TaxID=1754192 RepID=A0A1Y1WW84_9FUNG|nr:hypothetical protein BCR32DRAFT_328768 [Anaeromyces robustus]|eukprot:ORX77817.1 hypothetical protein BCR32DRAFT_328768 [Anaeromyces robustus]